MNPLILRALTALGRFGGSPGGVPMNDSLHNFNLPEFALAEFDDTEANNSKKGMERLKGAFESLRDMHKRPEIAAMQGPMEAALMQGPPMPPMGPEAPPMAQQPPAPPMPMQRPPQAPQPSPMEMAMSAPPEQAPMQEEMPWWKRNAYMQQDPTTGEYLNPMQAAQAMQGFA